jgi:hypothetical protein
MKTLPPSFATRKRRAGTHGEKTVFKGLPHIYNFETHLDQIWKIILYI